MVTGCKVEWAVDFVLVSTVLSILKQQVVSAHT